MIDAGRFLTAPSASCAQLLEKAGLPHAADMQRGWDHGVFVPMMLLFPAADIPVVQVSLTSDQDAATQLAIGAALRPLRDEGVLIVGSGVSFHNFAYLFARGKARETGVRHSLAFDKWLSSTMTDSAIPAASRLTQLAQWTAAPSAREAHPAGAAEHLLPALVVAAAAEGVAGTKVGLTAEAGAEIASDFAISQFEFR